MFRRNTNSFVQEVQQVKQELKQSTDFETEAVLSNYLCQIKLLISELSKEKADTIYKILGNEKIYRHFNSRLKDYEEEMINCFMESKDFHHDYLRDVYYGILFSFSNIQPPIITEPTEFSKKDFLDLFYQFLQSIHLDGEFEKMLKDGRIYSHENSNIPFLGWTIQNPITKKCSIVINQEEKTLDSMSTLAHEFGHAYIMEKTIKNLRDFRLQACSSFYGEVTSRLFERLFIGYLLKYGILPEEAKDLFYNYLSFQMEFLFGAYLESKFPDDILYNSFYKKMGRHELYDMIKEGFLLGDHLYAYFQSHAQFDILGDYKYAYGDILSLFLQRAVEEEGFSSPEFQRFVDHICELFDESYLLDNGYTADQYVREHQKQLTIFKK